MALTDIALTKQALARLGEYGIDSFDEGTDLANTANQIVPSTVRWLLTMHPWRFTMTKARLARLADAPLNEWTWQHALPPDRLMVRAIRTSGTAGAPPLREYEIFGNRVASHHEDLWCDYQQEQDPATWPAYFYQLALTALAAELAVPIGAGTTAAQLFHQKAFGTPSEAMNGGLMRQARTQDSQQQPPQLMTDFPLLQARWGNR